MDVDANGSLKVEAEEPRSGAKAMITISQDKRKNLLIKIHIIDLYSLQNERVEMRLKNM